MVIYDLYIRTIRPCRTNKAVSPGLELSVSAALKPSCSGTLLSLLSPCLVDDPLLYCTRHLEAPFSLLAI